MVLSAAVEKNRHNFLALNVINTKVRHIAKTFLKKKRPKNICLKEIYSKLKSNDVFLKYQQKVESTMVVCWMDTW